jgi:hypothetical protein
VKERKGEKAIGKRPVIAVNYLLTDRYTEVNKKERRN